MPLRIDVPHQTRTVLSRDGTRIFYVVAGEGKRDFVLCPGLGGPVLSYKYLIEHLGHAYRFITWEPRGLFRSGTPAGGQDALRVEDHVADLEAIGAQEGLERFVLGGWSMGVQVSLEYAFRHREQCESLVLISGTWGRVLRNIAGLSGADRLLVPLTRAVGAAGAGVGAAMRLLLDRRPTVSLLKAARVFTDNPSFFREILGEFKTLDFGRYAQMILKLNEHTADDYLEQLEIPTLVAVGTNDPMVPPALGRELARRLPQAELMVIENGTHYALIEYPHALNVGTANFLRRVHPETTIERPVSRAV